MRLFSFLSPVSFASLIFSNLLYLSSSTSDGLTDLVTWDPYSLTVNGARVFLYGAEFHYQRLPIPELWLDVFQKFRASGFNAIRCVYNIPRLRDFLS